MKIGVNGSTCYVGDEPDENGVYHGEWKHSGAPVSARWNEDICEWEEQGPTLIEVLEEYEAPLRKRAEELRVKHGKVWNDVLQAVGWVEEDEIVTWGDPEPVRQDRYQAWEDRDFGRSFTTMMTTTDISYEVLAMIYGKPQKKDYKRARDFRAARRRHARWKKGRP